MVHAHPGFTKTHPAHNCQPAAVYQDIICLYRSKVCTNLRAMKRNGALHRLCEYHRERANVSQKKWARRTRALDFTPWIMCRDDCQPLTQCAAGALEPSFSAAAELNTLVSSPADCAIASILSIPSKTDETEELDASVLAWLDGLADLS